MPRSNRPRRRSGGQEEPPELDLARALTAFKHSESKRDGVWYVQPVTVANATKVYVCPGCGNDIEPGIAHTVTWRADGIMGEENDLAGRRHWHLHCWRIRA